MTPHFTYKEAIKTATGLGNIPSPEVAANIGVTACYMEQVRSILLNNPIRVNSWFRSIEVNQTVGGSFTSDHMRGYAVDFTCKSFGTEYSVSCAIRDHVSNLRFDQLILEYGWVHISFAPAMRRQLLTKKSATTPYLVGLHK
jgi:zinc D-Ala-D-Ala carboxypeptidase